MILLELFLGFLEVGCFAFGGAYGAIPLIRDVVLRHGWLNEETLTYMIAVSESTPGPIMVNMATYIGSSQAGLLGAAVATIAVALPAFLIILLIAAFLKTALKNNYVQAVLRGLKPCVIGIVLATGIHMIISNCFSEELAGNFIGKELDIPAMIIAALLFAAMQGYKRWKKQKLSPILLIVIAAMLGIVVYGGI